MITFEDEDWEMFTGEVTLLSQDSDQQESIQDAIVWLEKRKKASDCPHLQVREITTITAGTKKFCMNCDEQLQ